MKQISFQISGETERQMAQLAAKWELPAQRHATAVIERVIAMMTLLESAAPGAADGAADRDQ